MWISPVPYRLVLVNQSLSFLQMQEGETGLPIQTHPGAFGVTRKHHIHEGVDLYVPEGTEVRAVEDGQVVALGPFTGEHASPPSPWWNDTWFVMIEGKSGVVNYGEVRPAYGLTVDSAVDQGAIIGHVIPVLRKDKGRPMSMLHIELYEPGIRTPVEWPVGAPKPRGLLDPTDRLSGKPP